MSITKNESHWLTSIICATEVEAEMQKKSQNIGSGDRVGYCGFVDFPEFRMSGFFDGTVLCDNGSLYKWVKLDIKPTAPISIHVSALKLRSSAILQRKFKLV